MSNLLLYRNRLKTIRSLYSVMSAMLIITAAKIKKSKIRFFHASKYYEEAKILAEILCGRPELDPKKALLVVIGTNKGLCGNFNEKIMAEAKKHLDSSGLDYDLALIGKKTKGLKKRPEKTVMEDAEAIRMLNSGSVSKIAQNVYDWVSANSGQVFVAYNEYKSVLSQKPSVVKIYPFDAQESDAYIIEPNPVDLRDPIMKLYFESILYKLIAESELGELNSRMILVKGATDTSEELIGSLTLQINKTRQADITAELAEITSSFEALSNEGEG